MKIAESWLRRWADPDQDLGTICDLLTKAGHEVDDVSAYGTGLDGIVVAEIVSVDRHPDADRLSLCQVSIGQGDPIDIVCGAPNVKAGMKSPLAPVGIKLPGGLKIRKSKIRGVVSNGMLCSAVELGLGAESDGIIELAADAPVGTSLAEYLGLPDHVIDLDLTPNRGDCFSVLGIARDLSALTGAELKSADYAAVASESDEGHDIVIESPDLCPSFAGQVVRNIRTDAKTPSWMAERLRRSGLRPIHLVVDITNYVMLELGQPLHAYDQKLLQGALQPRLAKTGESVELLDGKTVEPDDSTIVIADKSGVIGLAGIMGGLSTAVTDATTDVFFEAAYWPPEHIAGKARSYGMHTDASLRFERGVDPAGQSRAVARATSLLLEAAGGEPGPAQLLQSENELPARETIVLRRKRLELLLGVAIDDKTVATILRNLELGVSDHDQGWSAQVPSHRFDIEIEADLIEEVARIYGYDAIPEITSPAPTPLAVIDETRVPHSRVADTLIARDFQEVITYSFIDAESDAAISGKPSTLVLTNPISSEMSVMRSSLWPGILRALAGNLARQQDRVRVFETGKCFSGELGDHEETVVVAGAVAGNRSPEQWGSQAAAVDFFDLKADLMAVLLLAAPEHEWGFETDSHPALQPGQSAAVKRDGNTVGRIGKLDPRQQKLFDLKRDVFVFELDVDSAFETKVPAATPISKYPSIRRDIAVLVDAKVTSYELTQAVISAAPELISGVRIFDIYTGPGVEAGLKSVALGLILQETSRTLTDDDADAAMTAAVQKLQVEFAAELRD